MPERNPDLPEQPEEEIDLDPEMTVIIDESDFEDDVPTIVVEPEVEEVLVVLPDEEDEDFEEVTLLDHHPATEPEALTEAMPTDAYEECLAEDAEPVEVEALPDLEHVEDITALLQNESVPLEAPTDFRAVRLEEAATRRRVPWFALAAVACLAVSAFLYGPQLVDRFKGEGSPGSIARAQKSSATTNTEETSTAADESKATAVVPSAADTVDPEIEKVSFREWVTTALAHNLGAVEVAPTDSVDRNTPVEPIADDTSSDQENK